MKNPLSIKNELEALNAEFHKPTIDKAAIASINKKMFVKVVARNCLVGLGLGIAGGIVIGTLQALSEIATEED